MPAGASHHFRDNESGNLGEDELNSLDIGGNVYVEGPGSLNVNVTACRYNSAGGFVDFAGATGFAIPPSTLNQAVYLTVPGNVLTVGASFPGGAHVPLAEVDTSGTEVIAVRDKRAAMTAVVSGSPPGDVTGPAGATAGAVPLFGDASGKLLANGPSPGLANGLATLNAGQTVVQNPANAQTTPAASKIPLANGSGKISDGWLEGNPVYGRDQQDQQGATRTTNATTTPQAHTTLSIPALTGTYRIDWKAELDNAGFAGEVDLYDVTGAAVLDGPQIRVANDASERLPVGGFAIVALAGSPKDVAVRFKDVAGGNTQGLGGVKISLHRIS